MQYKSEDVKIHLSIEWYMIDLIQVVLCKGTIMIKCFLCLQWSDPNKVQMLWESDHKTV